MRDHGYQQWLWLRSIVSGICIPKYVTAKNPYRLWYTSRLLQMLSHTWLLTLNTCTLSSSLRLLLRAGLQPRAAQDEGASEGPQEGRPGAG
jgi:hypothetical protein